MVSSRRNPSIDRILDALKVGVFGNPDHLYTKRFPKLTYLESSSINGWYYQYNFISHAGAGEDDTFPSLDDPNRASYYQCWPKPRARAFLSIRIADGLYEDEKMGSEILGGSRLIYNHRGVNNLLTIEPSVNVLLVLTDGKNNKRSTSIEATFLFRQSDPYYVPGIPKYDRRLHDYVCVINDFPSYGLASELYFSEFIDDLTSLIILSKFNSSDSPPFDYLDTIYISDVISFIEFVSNPNSQKYEYGAPDNIRNSTRYAKNVAVFNYQSGKYPPLIIPCVPSGLLGFLSIGGFSIDLKSYKGVGFLPCIKYPCLPNSDKTYDNIPYPYINSHCSQLVETSYQLLVHPYAHYSSLPGIVTGQSPGEYVTLVFYSPESFKQNYYNGSVKVYASGSQTLPYGFHGNNVKAQKAIVGSTKVMKEVSTTPYFTALFLTPKSVTLPPPYREVSVIFIKTERYYPSSYHPTHSITLSPSVSILPNNYGFDPSTGQMSQLLLDSPLEINGFPINVVNSGPDQGTGDVSQVFDRSSGQAFDVQNQINDPNDASMPSIPKCCGKNFIQNPITRSVHPLINNNSLGDFLLEAIELHWKDFATFHATTDDGYFKDLNVSTKYFSDPEIFQICVPYTDQDVVFTDGPLIAIPHWEEPLNLNDYFKFRVRNGCVEYYNPVTESYQFDRFDDMLVAKGTGYVVKVERDDTGGLSHEVEYYPSGFLSPGSDQGYTLPSILFGHTVAFYSISYPNPFDPWAKAHHLETNVYWRFPILDPSYFAHPPVKYSPPIDPSSVNTAGFWRLSFILEYQNFSLSNYSVPANSFFSGTVFIAGSPAYPPIVSATTNCPIAVWRDDFSRYPCWEFKRTSDFSALISPSISTYSLEYFYNGDPVTGCLPWKSW